MLCVELMTPNPFRLRTLPSGFNWRFETFTLAGLAKCAQRNRAEQAHVEIRHTRPSDRIHARRPEPGFRDRLERGDIKVRSTWHDAGDRDRVLHLIGALAAAGRVQRR